MSEIPNCVDDLTARFLGDILGSDVRSIDLEPIGLEAGILGELARVHLTYGPQASGPPSVVVKLPTSAAQNRAVGMAFKFYEREVRFYQELAADSGIAVPHCFFSHSAPEREEFILVLEDLSGYRQVDQSDGASIAEARLVVESAAAMHAHWWSRAELDAFDWLPRIDGPGERDLTNELYADGWSPFLDRFGDALTTEQIAAGEVVRRHFTDVIDHLGTDPTTIAHGDLRVGNLFFDARATSRRLVVIDWQIAIRARGAFDLAYFVGGSLETSQRQQNERELVAEYHEVLCSSGVIDYSFDQCWDDYRWSLMYASVYPIDAGSFDLPNEASVTMVREWSSRFFAAVADLDCIDLLT
jgi:hypothetical protein